METALALVDREGFDALSLRAVARALGVTPMALYTYVRSSDELAAMVIERMVALKAEQLEIPDDWRDALRTFAAALAELVGDHPALLQVYARGAVDTPAALRVAEQVLTRLRAAGFTPPETADAYGGVHALVLGHCLLRQTNLSDGPQRTGIDAAELPTVAALLAAGSSPRGVSLSALVDLLIGGIESGRLSE